MATFVTVASSAGGPVPLAIELRHQEAGTYVQTLGRLAPSASTPLQLGRRHQPQHEAGAPWAAVASSVVGLAVAAKPMSKVLGRLRRRRSQALAAALARPVSCGPSEVRHRRTALAAAVDGEVEVVEPFVSACSTNAEWTKAVDELAEAVGPFPKFEAGVAFISDAHLIANGLAPVLEALREKLGVQTLIGCAVGGVIGSPCLESTGRPDPDISRKTLPAGEPEAEVIDASVAAAEGAAAKLPVEVERGPSLSVGLLRECGATPFFIGGDEKGGMQGDLALLSRKASEGSVRSCLLMADPFGPIEELLNTLDERFPKAVKAGGISAMLQVGDQDRRAFTPSIGIAAEGCQVRLCNQGIIGLLLEDMEVHTITCQGCRAVGPTVKVTSVEGPTCTGIGGRPAREALQLIFSAVDAETREKMQKGLTLGLAGVNEEVSNIGDGDWLVRGISSITPNGGLVIGGGVMEGQPLRFHVRDRDSAEADLSMMLNRYRLEKRFSAADSGQPVGSFVFTCNGRGQNLYGRRHVDARAASEASTGSSLEESGPLLCSNVAGAFCNGEIGSPGVSLVPSDDEADATLKRTALHGFTAVMALLIPRK
eukprot:TRINITY_DN14252_c0_g1_i1.p1 TRINITY_DN14252_c0_g1~~TRINITY_DN14252_c0_g1_i1.p1  ORF type:complete len:596 (+),score=123.53 TRINITY_DN14252_c0_g1_i1:103-1890(+)